MGLMRSVSGAPSRAPPSPSSPSACTSSHRSRSQKAGNASRAWTSARTTRLPGTLGRSITTGTSPGWVRRNYCCADPSIGAEHGLSNRWGKPASIRNEFLGHGIALNSANNDRRAGYLRLLELIHPELDRIPPPWSQVPRELGAAPRLYIFATCPHLIEQLKNAPIRVDGRDAGEMVDANWESAHGHACASARYGAMSRPGPSPEPEPEPGDWREAEQRRLLSRHEDDSYYDEQRERNLIDV